MQRVGSMNEHGGRPSRVMPTATAATGAGWPFTRKCPLQCGLNRLADDADDAVPRRFRRHQRWGGHERVATNRRAAPGALTDNQTALHRLGHHATAETDRRLAC